MKSGKQPGIYEDRLSMMIDDGSVPLFKEQGCWLTWHNGARDNPDLPTKAAGGFLDEYRNNDAGKPPFSKNIDKKTHQPKYMYDAKVFGKKSVTVDDIRKMPTALIREKNAVPFDPNAGWKKGDLIPEYIVSREDAKGPAADNKNVKGVWKDGMRTVVWARPLNLTNPDDKALKEGGAYTFGFAAHDDNITTRGHFVSFPVSVGFGAEAAIEATKLN